MFFNASYSVAQLSTINYTNCINVTSAEFKNPTKELVKTINVAGVLFLKEKNTIFCISSLASNLYILERGYFYFSRWLERCPQRPTV